MTQKQFQGRLFAVSYATFRNLLIQIQEHFEHAGRLHTTQPKSRFASEAVQEGWDLASIKKRQMDSRQRYAPT